MEPEKTMNSQNGLILSDFKQHHKAIVIKKYGISTKTDLKINGE